MRCGKLLSFPKKDRIIIINVTYDLEPEPVEDLYARDDGEASEEAHHAAHPGDLVRDGHSGILGDLDKSF